MITIRQGIFETNSSSADYYYDDMEKIDIGYNSYDIEIFAKIIFNNDEKTIQLLKMIEDKLYDIISDIIKELQIYELYNVELKENEIIFSYLSKYRATVSKAKYGYDAKILNTNNYIPFKLDEFPNKNGLKNKIIMAIKNEIKNIILTNKEECNKTHILECIENENILKIDDIYSYDLYDCSGYSEDNTPFKSYEDFIYFLKINLEELIAQGPPDYY